MTRIEGRQPEAMRPVCIKAKVNPYAEGSALCSFGRTEVLCTASVENKVPRWLEDDSRGWVTAEYAMLPRSTHTRTSRDHRTHGRAQEISRLIGRSLRASVDLAALAGNTIKVDCDVLVADGGTRTASITGGYVALALAMNTLGVKPMFPVAAVSCGKVAGQVVVDLCYEEDSTAEVDLNLVLAPGGRLVEVQSTAEQGFFSSAELERMVALGQAAAEELFALQTAAINGS
jgi:ribonuclease PH